MSMWGVCNSYLCKDGLRQVFRVVILVVLGCKIHHAHIVHYKLCLAVSCCGSKGSIMQTLRTVVCTTGRYMDGGVGQQLGLG